MNAENPFPNHSSGLANLGNTCFLNACLQVLAHTHEIVREHHKYERHMRPIPETQIFVEWLKLRNEMFGSATVVAPQRFVQCVQHVARLRNKDIFTGWAQNDMPEFLLFMVECIHQSICRPVVMNINGMATTAKDKLAMNCYRMLQQVYQKEYSEVMDLFYGIYVSEIASASEHGNAVLSAKPEHFFALDLPLPLPTHAASKPDAPSLYDCFDAFTQSEVLAGENAWHNEKTGKYQNVVKRITFWNMPKVLIVNIKRFSPDGHHKINHPVHFPLDNLDLSKYVCGYGGDKYVYELYGVCNHTGNIMGGHYTACVRGVNGMWYHYNDTHVSLLGDCAQGFPSTFYQMAYCLFYRKKYN